MKDTVLPSCYLCISWGSDIARKWWGEDLDSDFHSKRSFFFFFSKGGAHICTRCWPVQGKFFFYNFLLHINLVFLSIHWSKLYQGGRYSLLYFKWYLPWCKILGTSTTLHVVFENNLLFVNLVKWCTEAKQRKFPFSLYVGYWATLLRIAIILIPS